MVLFRWSCHRKRPFSKDPLFQGNLRGTYSIRSYFQEPWGLHPFSRFIFYHCSLLVSSSIAPLSQYDTRWKCADEITSYTDRLIYIPRHIKIQPLPTLEGRTQESEPTTSKLVDNLDVAASPCHVGLID